jgi:hypothetical protein
MSCKGERVKEFLFWLSIGVLAGNVHSALTRYDWPLASTIILIMAWAIGYKYWKKTECK